MENCLRFGRGLLYRLRCEFLQRCGRLLRHLLLHDDRGWEELGDRRRGVCLVVLHVPPHVPDVLERIEGGRSFDGYALGQSLEPVPAILLFVLGCFGLVSLPPPPHQQACHSLAAVWLPDAMRPHHLTGHHVPEPDQRVFWTQLRVLGEDR